MYTVVMCLATNWHVYVFLMMFDNSDDKNDQRMEWVLLKLILINFPY